MLLFFCYCICSRRTFLYAEIGFEIGEMSLCRGLDVMLWNTVFYSSMNVWCWVSSFLSLTFLFMTSTLHGLLFDWAAYTHERSHSWKRKNLKALVPSRSVQPCKQHQCHMEKKESHIMLEPSSKCFAFHSSVLFFSLFSCTLSPILALESGKERAVVVVVVVVGNISCEWCPSSVTPELLF